jgi:drug/metabolite transporter (DMT)-like permease
MLKRLAPAIFVLLWSTGFVVARYGSEDAGPLTFLTVRTAILWVVARMVRESRLARPQIPIQVITGLGIHAMYLGGVWVAIDHGLPSGISALIAALHPVVTTVLSRVLLGEELTRRRAVGVLLGFLGVIAVVIEHGGAGEGVTGFAVGAMAIAVTGMAGGTLVQRRFAVGTPLLGGTALQYLATTIALGMLTLSWEGWDFHITTRSIFSLVWSVLILSVAAILIMLWLLHHQAAAQVSSLFFLTPALSTIEGALLFQERLHPLSIIGLVIAVVGVWLATSTPNGVTSLQK